MNAITSGKSVVRSRSWRRFFLLLGMFLAALFVADLLPMGGWSDVRSKWLNAVADAVVCVVFLSITALTYWKGGPLTGLQTSLLCLIFGCGLALTVEQLYTDMLFLRELRSRHGSARTQVPNPRSAADAGLAFRFQFGSQWPGAADSARWATATEL